MTKYSRTKKKLSILLIDEDLDDLPLLQQQLRQTDFRHSSISRTSNLEEGLDLLSRNSFDVIILSLDSIESVIQLREKNSSIPLITMGKLSDDDQTIVDAISMGAQDYLPKKEINAHLLERSITYSIERQQVHEGLRELTMTDELTKLYNRRGFLTLAENQISFAKRHDSGFLLFLIDVNFFKQINDKHGHPVGDQALQDFANCMKNSFRKHDILARIGGDEFAALAIQTNGAEGETLRTNFMERVKAFNVKGGRPYELSGSIGYSQYKPNDNKSLDDIMQEADQMLYQHKKMLHR